MILLAPRLTLHASRARTRCLALVHHGISSPRSQPGIWNPQAHLTNTSQQGGKNRRRGKNENDNEKRELVFKEEGQEYAQVVKMLGNGRLEAQCFDGARRLAHIRGKLRKKVWINQGDIILLSLRDYQDEKGDVIMKYSGKPPLRHDRVYCCAWWQSVYMCFFGGVLTFFV